MDNLEQYFADQLTSRSQQGILRKLSITPQGLKDFTSNDYLGLARLTELQARITNRLTTMNVRQGATGSRLLSGNSVLHEALEGKLATLFKAPACLIFNSGYAANIGVLSTIPTRNDLILYDERCHASIKDGIRLSLATKHVFKHNDLDDLERKIKRSKGKIFVVAESIYSMDGDHCPLAELVELSEKHQAFLILDEAHSTGTTGPDGSGLAVDLGVEAKIAVRIYTFGKAIGAHGACVTGSRRLIDYLINFSKPFIYTTALPEHTIVTLMESFDLIQQNPSLQQQLKGKIQLFRQSVKIPIQESVSAIQAIIIPSVQKTRDKALHLTSRGFDVRPIFSPTVKAGTERLRICLHTFNSDEDVIALAQELNKE
jgi:8-amino-7-oxononanoate synthase